MRHLVDVELEIRASREAIFDRLSDHARYREFSGIRASELLTPGREEPNGTGAVRMIRAASGVRFVEEIREFERPSFFRYQILECTLPMRHLGGEIRLEAQDGATHVTWRSEFETRLPLLGPIAARLGADGFRSILKAVRRDLE